MQTKLTLRIDSALIEQAKGYARLNHKSLSALVTHYFLLLNSKKQKTLDESELPPVVRSLAGSLGKKKLSVKDYHRHLERKYL